MGTFTGPRSEDLNRTLESNSERRQSQPTTIIHVNQVRFYQKLDIVSETGGMKRLTLRTEWEVMLPLGIAGAIFGGTLIYFLGSNKVMNMVKHLVEIVSNMPLHGVEPIQGSIQITM